VGASPDAERESQRFSQAYHDAAAESELDIQLLDLRDHVTSSPVDGIHFEAEGHRAIGIAVATAVRGLLGRG
jgi:lysophospholipase L1-like esterase